MRRKPSSVYHRGAEGSIPVPDGGEPLDDGLLALRDALSHEEHHEGVASGLHGVGVPFLRFLRQEEGVLTVLCAPYVALDGLFRPVDLPVWGREGDRWEGCGMLVLVIRTYSS